MKSLPLMMLLGTFSLTACAAQPQADAGAGTPVATATANQAPAKAVEAGTPEARARAVLATLAPDLEIDRVGPAELPGFQQVIAAGQVLYVSDDGKYMLQGGAFDMQSKRDLNQEAMSGFRAEQLAKVPRGERIVFAPANPKYTVSVFTDVECGYCRRLHQDIARYNELGIAIEYLAYPRMGLGTDDYREMVAVWCAQDRNKALTDAKGGRKLPSRECKNPVASHFQLGQKVGLTGTPMIVAADGSQMPGYMPPADLLKALQDLENAGRKVANRGG